MKVYRLILLLSAIGTLNVILTLPNAHGDSSFPYFSFGAAGDIASGSNHNALVDKLNSSNAKFFIALGDLSYQAQEQAWCDKWKTGAGNPSGKSFKNIELATGNHESGETNFPGDGNVNTFIAQCGLGALTTFTSAPSKSSNNNRTAGCTWPNDTTKCYAKEYYFDWPSSTPIARFISVTAQVTFDSSIDSARRWTYDSCGTTNTHCRWARDAIDNARSSGIKWVIVMMHKNHIEMTPGIGSAIGQEFFDMLVDRKVDLILQGHAHNYERSNQLSLSANCPSLTTTYVSACVVATGNKFFRGDGSILTITGTGGQTLDSLDPQESDAPYFQARDAATFGYLNITMNQLRMDVTFVKTAGTGTFTETFSILAKDDAAFEFDWSDSNNDGNVNIQDIADIGFYSDQTCISWTQTYEPCYWDIDGPHNGTGKVDIKDVATAAVYYNTKQSAPYLGQGYDLHTLDEFWRGKCGTFSKTVNRDYCDFYFLYN